MVWSNSEGRLQCCSQVSVAAFPLSFSKALIVPFTYSSSPHRARLMGVYVIKDSSPLHGIQLIFLKDCNNFSSQKTEEASQIDTQEIHLHVIFTVQ